MLVSQIIWQETLVSWPNGEQQNQCLFRTLLLLVLSSFCLYTCPFYDPSGCRTHQNSRSHSTGSVPMPSAPRPGGLILHWLVLFLWVVCDGPFLLIPHTLHLNFHFLLIYHLQCCLFGGCLESWVGSHSERGIHAGVPILGDLFGWFITGTVGMSRIEGCRPVWKTHRFGGLLPWRVMCLGKSSPQHCFSKLALIILTDIQLQSLLLTSSMSWKI